MTYENDKMTMTDHCDAIKTERKRVSGFFFAITFAMALAYIVVLGGYATLVYFMPQLEENKLLSLLVNNFYTVALILLFLLFSKSHKMTSPKYITPISVGKFFRYVIISVSLMAIGALIGQGVNAFIEAIFGISVFNGVEDMVENYSKIQVFLAAVIIAPLTEEFVFRKLLIDKLSRFGTSFCVVISGITFGVFHGNFYQLFYGVALGMLLGYIYCVHGKLRYTILLHALINFMGAIIPLFTTSILESGNVISLMVASVYSILYILCIPLGAVFLVLEYKKNKNLAVQGILISPFKTILKNAGFILFVLYGIAMFAFTILMS